MGRCWEWGRVCGCACVGESMGTFLLNRSLGHKFSAEELGRGSTKLLVHFLFGGLHVIMNLPIGVGRPLPTPSHRPPQLTIHPISPSIQAYHQPHLTTHPSLPTTPSHHPSHLTTYPISPPTPFHYPPHLTCNHPPPAQRPSHLTSHSIQLVTYHQQPVFMGVILQHNVPNTTFFHIFRCVYCMSLL